MVYTLTTVTPGTPFLVLFFISTFNFIMVQRNLKYTDLFKCIGKCVRYKETMTKLRQGDPDNFYQYIQTD